MQQFLILSGYVLWGLILVGGCTLALLSWKAYRKIKKLAAQGAATSGPLAPKIKLIPLSAPPWVNTEAVGAQVRDLRREGFRLIDSYSVKGIENLYLMGLFHPEYDFCAVVYDGYGFVWTDIVLVYENGDTLTVGNAPQGGEMDTRPGTTKLFLRDKTPGELFSRALSEEMPLPTVSINESNFVAIVEREYAADAVWRNERGTTPREVAAVGRDMGLNINMTDAEIPNYLERERLCRVVMHTFLADEPMTALAWEKRREGIHVVLDQDGPDELEMVLMESEDYEDHWMDVVRDLYDADMGALEIFEQVSGKAETHAFAYVGGVDQPKGVLYFLPEEEHL